MSSLGTPSGLRRLTRPMLMTFRTAEAFTGTTGLLPGQVLAAFKAAAPFLGLRTSLVHLVDWLFKFTQPIDWEGGSRPIVWPSAGEQQAALGLSASHVKNLNRQLAELGLVIMRDSPTGRRYGIRARGRSGPIIEAYGFDLSPLAMRMSEFLRIAAEGRAQRGRIKALRRRATIARKGFRQLLATADAELVAACDVPAWQSRWACVDRGIAEISDEALLATAVAELERLTTGAQGTLALSIDRERQAPKPVETGPSGPTDWPPITTTNGSSNPSDTVAAAGTSGGDPAHAYGIGRDPRHRQSQREPERAHMRDPRNRARQVISPAVATKLTPRELARLAPSLRPYLPRAHVTWPEIVDAADWARGAFGISKWSWSEACLALGRERAAVAVAIVTTKPEGHFYVGPAAYFLGMIRRAQRGGFNLDKSICGLRAQMARQHS